MIIEQYCISNVNRDGCMAFYLIGWLKMRWSGSNNWIRINNQQYLCGIKYTFVDTLDPMTDSLDSLQRVDKIETWLDITYSNDVTGKWILSEKAVLLVHLTTI